MAVTHPHGLFSWTDLSLPDPAGGRAFYSSLFGWDAADQFDPEGNYIYTMFTKRGKSIVADPQGAVFSLWQAGDHPGAETFNNHGELTWNELATRDTEGAKAFYAAVLGWEFEAFAGPSEYWLIKIERKSKGTLHQDDDYNGGIMAMDENWPADLPPHWMVYFLVDDTDVAAARVEELGGKVSVPPFDSSAGRIAVVGDSQGGTFSIIATPAQP